MILIDDKQVDYSTSDLLPFVVRFRTDDFWNFGTSVGNELSNFSNRIVLPATPRNSSILSDQKQPIRVVRDGQVLFEGECMVTERILEAGRVVRYGLAVYGGNYALFSALDGVSLNTLDLGTQEWSNLAIRDSWLAASTAKGVFAPVIYGALSPSLPPLSDDIVEFSPSNMRFAVYFRAIVDAIASEIGYTIQSDFMDTDYFKRIVFLYSVGGSPRVADPLRVDSFLNTAKPIVLSETNLFFQGAIDTNAATYPNYLLDEMTIQFDSDNANNSWALPSGDAFRMGKDGEVELDTHIATSVQNRYRVRISKNNFETVAEFPTDKRQVITVQVKNGDTLRVKLTANQANATGGNILPSNTYFRVNSRIAAVNEVFDVASCLPAVEAKTFMRDLTRMFNLVWNVQRATRTIRVETRFDNPLTRGWYHAPSFVAPRSFNLAAEHSETHDERLRTNLTFAYRSGDDPVIEAFAERQASRLDVGSVQARLGDGDQRIALELFEPLPMASVQNAAMSNSVPVLLPSDTDLSRMEAMPTPNFKAGYRCALVHRDAVIGAYNGTIVAMPLLADTVPVNGLRLTFESGADGLGLVDSFYARQLQLMPDNRNLEADAIVVRSGLTSEDFRTLVAHDGGLWIVMEIEANLDTNEAAKVALTKFNLLPRGTSLSDNRIQGDYVFSFTTP